MKSTLTLVRALSGAAFVAIALISAPVIAQDRLDQLEQFEALDLSAEQMSQIRSIRQEQRDDLEANRETLRQERETLRTLMVGDTDRATLEAQFQQIQQLRHAQEEAMFATMLEIREILSPEQRQQLAEITAERRDRWQSERPQRGFRSN